MCTVFSKDYSLFGSLCIFGNYLPRFQYYNILGFTTKLPTSYNKRMLSVFVIYRRKQDKSYKKCHFSIDILNNLPSKFNFVISVHKIVIKSLFVSMIK